MNKQHNSGVESLSSESSLEHEHGHGHGHDASCQHSAAPSIEIPVCAPATCHSSSAPSEMTDLAHSTQTQLHAYIPEMDCPAEEQMIRTKLGKLKAVLELEFNLMQRRLRVEHLAGQGDSVLIALRQLGFNPVLAGAGAGQQQDKSVVPVATASLWRMCVAVILALGAEALAWAQGPEYLVIAMAIIAIGLSGWSVYKKGLVALRNGQLNINALMSIAVTGAVLLRQWPEAAMVMALFSVAEWLEARSLDRARQAVDKLMDLAPDLVQVSQDGLQWQSVSARQVQANTWVRVPPGGRLALDGYLRTGVALLNQAHITGESAPVEKRAGDMVYAGSINGLSELRYQVSGAFDQTLLAKIARSVQHAQASKAPVQRFVDQFSRYYTPAVVVLALGIALLLPLLFNWAWHDAIYKALVLLVIACPCALVISTPVAVVSALAHAASRGILVKGGAYLEKARRLRFLALDKTGTLTQGKPQLQTGHLLSSQYNAGHCEQLALILAQGSDHPASQALARGLSPVESLSMVVAEFQAEPGGGVQAWVDGELLRLGKRSWVLELTGLAADKQAIEQEAEQKGASLVYLGNKQGLLMFFEVLDTLKPEASNVIAQLKALGIQTTILSGDHPAAVRYMAEQAGISHYQAAMLPQDKLAWVEQSSAQGLVGMVGDGINDAPALARADIGIAMGALGSDMAIETADIALMDDDLAKLPALILQSRRLHTVLVQNISLALGIKLVFLVLAALGMASMWMAVFADVGTSLLVVLNSLRLLRDNRRA